MAHKMGLVKITLGTKEDVENTRITITSGDYTFYDYLVSVTSSGTYTGASPNKPYQASSTVHYFIATLNQSASFICSSTIAGTADVGNNWSLSKNITTGGEYGELNPIPATSYLSTSTSYVPAIGDVFYSSGALSHTYDSNYGTPVGLVYNLNPTTKDIALGYKTGYVMALKQCYERQRVEKDNNAFATGAALEASVTDMLVQSGSASYMINDRDGLTHCLYAKNHYASYSTECMQMLIADNFRQVSPIPDSGTSGWYIPSSGQTVEWLYAFSCTYGQSDYVFTSNSEWTPEAGNVDNWPTAYLNNYRIFTPLETLCGKINSWFTGKNLPSEYYRAWTGDYYWTSTEMKPDIVVTLDFHPTVVTLQNNKTYKKTYTDRTLRCVLAF